MMSLFLKPVNEHTVYDIILMQIEKKNFEVYYKDIYLDFLEEIEDNFEGSFYIEDYLSILKQLRKMSYSIKLNDIKITRHDLIFDFLDSVEVFDKKFVCLDSFSILRKKLQENEGIVTYNNIILNFLDDNNTNDFICVVIYLEKENTA